MKYEIEINGEIKTVEVKDKQVILLLQGCPASGKSTFAEKLFQASKDHEGTFEDHKNKFVIVCRDDIRAAKGIDQRDFSRELEVSVEQMRQVHESLGLGYSVIIADTNLNPKYFPIWDKLAKEYNAEVQKLLIYIPYWEAVKRDKARDRHVGHKAIEHFYKLYFPEKLKEELTDKRIINEFVDYSKDDCIICDLDGTIALHRGRSPYEWDKIPTDKMDPRMARIINRYFNDGVKIIFLTGRPEYVRESTEEWIKKSFDNLNMRIACTLIMRDDKDNRKGAISKQELYEKYVKDRYNVLCVFEDSNSCVQMWRSLGLLTCQVANGDY